MVPDIEIKTELFVIIINLGLESLCRYRIIVIAICHSVCVPEWD